MISQYLSPIKRSDIINPLKRFRKHGLIESLIHVSIRTDERDIKAGIQMLPGNMIRLMCQDEEYFLQVLFTDKEVKQAVELMNNFLDTGDIEPVRNTANS